MGAMRGRVSLMVSAINTPVIVCSILARKCTALGHNVVPLIAAFVVVTSYLLKIQNLHDQGQRVRFRPTRHSNCYVARTSRSVRP